MESPTVGDLPSNLPVGSGTLPDYLSDTPAAINEPYADAALTDLEDHAHRQQVLMSSDAMRFLAGSVAADTQLETLDAVITAAKTAFPSDDGWVVLNLSRMQELMSREEAEAPVAATLAAAPVAAVTAGSLAEAIVTGNVPAAYQLIEHRPMVALADAAADFDALYRMRLGEPLTVSDLLQRESTTLSQADIGSIIGALTGAIDGTYTDERSAVKMAIMKAVKIVTNK